MISAAAERALERCDAEWLRAWEPEAELTVSEWADAHRVLSTVDSNEAGPWRTGRTPYLRAIQDAASARSSYRRIVVVKAAQIGYTAALLNVLGYRIDRVPASILLVMPNVTPDAKHFSRHRLDPMIASTPALKSKITERRGKGDAVNTISQKRFPGGTLMLAGANSAAGLRSMPIRYLFLDEVDEYDDTIGDQGDPVALAEARTRSFPHSKLVIMGSTPTIEGASRIMLAAERCSRLARYHVPCPECHALQPLEWERLRIKLSPVVYECAACRALIPERHREWMLADQRPPGDPAPAARWVFERDEGDDSIAFVDLSALYSPPGLGDDWQTIARAWGRAVRKLREEGDDGELQAFVNTTLGRPYRKPKPRQPEWKGLFERRDGYERGVVPNPPATEGELYLGPCFLTAGVDVQADRLEFEVVGWGRGQRSWSIDYGVLMGDPVTAGPWAALEEILVRAWPTAWGTTLPILCMAIDTGFLPEPVYAWAAGRPQPVQSAAGVRTPVFVAPDGTYQPRPHVVMVTKGVVDMDRPIRPRGGKQGEVAPGVTLFLLGTGWLKSSVYTRLRLTAPDEAARAAGQDDPPGFMRFPRYEAAWFQQLTSNHVVTYRVGGLERQRFEKAAGLQDEALDCRCGALAAAIAVGIDTMGEIQWAKAEAVARGQSAAAPPPRPSGGAPARPGGLRRRGGRAPR